MSDTGDQPVKIRILVLDEQPLLRQGISAYLNSQTDMVVCGEAESISEARRKIAEYQPQLLLTPLRLGVQSTFKFIKRVKTENAQLRILVYSAFEESIFAERALRVGANGYLMKQAPVEKLVSAIRDIAQGSIYVSREVALSAYRKSLQRPPENGHLARSTTSLEALSVREMHIFQLLGSGLAPRQIANSLDLSVKTVEAHQENIKHKLQLRSCAELREGAARWLERSLNTDERLYSGTSWRKRKAPSPVLRVLNELDTQQNQASQIPPDSAPTTASQLPLRPRHMQ